MLIPADRRFTTPTGTFNLSTAAKRTYLSGY